LVPALSIRMSMRLCRRRMDARSRLRHRFAVGDFELQRFRAAHRLHLAQRRVVCCGKKKTITIGPSGLVGTQAQLGKEQCGEQIGGTQACWM